MVFGVGNDAKYRVGLLGEGISESLTPEMHMREARRLGVGYDYELFDVPAATYDAAGLHAFLGGVRSDGFAAINVTHPYKQAVIPLLDDLSADAARLGAVNLVTFGPDGAIGHNTDWSGFRWAFQSALEPAGRDLVLQFGAGGAGAATLYALLTLGTGRVVVHDIERDRAKSLAERFGDAFPNQQVASAPQDLAGLWSSFDGVVHATPMGMAAHPGRPFDPESLRPDAWISEVVYLPIETSLVRAARACGRRVMDGSLMAAGQAIDSLRIITGLSPDPDRVRADLLELVAQSAEGVSG